MPGTRNDYGQMFDHELNPRKGWSGDRGAALEKALAISAAETEEVFAGMVVTVNDSNEFLLGTIVDPSTSQVKPPLFAFQNENDFDVNTDLGNIAGGVLMGLSCLGDFELESTEFDTAGTYLPGTLLTSPTTASANRGRIGVGVMSTDVICGIVSETGANANGSHENEHGQNVIRFWTWFFPTQPSLT